MIGIHPGLAGSQSTNSDGSNTHALPVNAELHHLAFHPRVSAPSTMEDEVTPVRAAAPNEAPPRAAAGEGTPLLPAPATTGVGKKKGGSGGTSDARAFKDDE